MEYKRSGSTGKYGESEMRGPIAKLSLYKCV